MTGGKWYAAAELIYEVRGLWFGEIIFFCYLSNSEKILESQVHFLFELSYLFLITVVEIGDFSITFMSYTRNSSLGNRINVAICECPMSVRFPCTSEQRAACSSSISVSSNVPPSSLLHPKIYLPFLSSAARVNSVNDGQVADVCTILLGITSKISA